MQKVFVHTIVQENLRRAICWVTAWVKGGLLLPIDKYAKARKLVEDVIVSKKPDLMPLSVEELRPYDNMPTLIDLDIMENTLDQVSNTIQVEVELGGIGISSLQGCGILILPQKGFTVKLCLH